MKDEKDFQCNARSIFGSLIFRQADFECVECKSWNRLLIPIEGYRHDMQCAVCGKYNNVNYTALFDKRPKSDHDDEPS
jgi:hypothetical protein